MDQKLRKQGETIKMAGNNAIQILRGNTQSIANSTETLLDGQLLYNTDKNYLTCGGGGANNVNSLPITCRELVAYQGDEEAISNGTTEVASIRHNANGLQVSSSGNLNIISLSSMCLSGGGGESTLEMNLTTAQLNSHDVNIFANTAANIDGGNVYINAQNTLNINSSNLNVSMSALNIGGSSLDAPSYIEFTSPISICSSYGIDLNSSTIEIGNGSHKLSITSEYMAINTDGNQLLFPSTSGTLALDNDIPKLRRVMSNLRLNNTQGSVWRFIAMGSTINVTVRIPDDAGSYEYNRTFNSPFEMVCGFPNYSLYASVVAGNDSYGSAYGSEILINCPAEMFRESYSEGALYYEKLL